MATGLPATRVRGEGGSPRGAPGGPRGAGRRARPIAGAAEDAGEDVRLPVRQVRLGVLPLREEADVLGDVGVGRASPLAVHDLVEITRIGNISRLHGGAPVIATGPSQGATAF